MKVSPEARRPAKYKEKKELASRCYVLYANSVRAVREKERERKRERNGPAYVKVVFKHTTF